MKNSFWATTTKGVIASGNVIWSIFVSLLQTYSIWQALTIYTKPDLISKNCDWGKDKLHITGLDGKNKKDYKNVQIEIMFVDQKAEGGWFLEIKKGYESAQSYWIVHIKPPAIFEDIQTPLLTLPLNEGQIQEFLLHHSRSNWDQMFQNLAASLKAFPLHSMTCRKGQLR